jgi:hypothetical protein
MTYPHTVEGADSGTGGSSVRVVRTVLEPGNKTLAAVGSTWTAVPDILLTIPDVAAGDEICVWPDFMFEHSVNFIDLAVSRNGSLVRFCSSGDGTPAVEGEPGLYQTPGTYRNSGVCFSFTATADDIHTDDTVTIVVATVGAGGGTLYASAAFPCKLVATIAS